ncbi:hypothetical protein J2S78_001870 [Salibacterium salarium]|uniref:hypothetical protein n=1 Tax=Salibacterium salarium TaxID=284579 RepID=UPI0027882CA5|nr:hypothetical protein [Salibacterium salarium]MDQ0299450.1 hypothetical protein [Salibacterium salarium]
MSGSKKIITMISISFALLLSGCMFPQGERAENQVPYDSQLSSVQQALDQFREDNNVLPIKTTEQETPTYQKYTIDFGKLIPRYMQEPPGNSFENGGSYQYVIIDPEDKAEVKVIDLSVMRNIQELQRAINMYIGENDYAPIKESVGPGLFEIDFDRLDYNGDTVVESPYHDDTSLPLLMNERGEVRIDYAIDINIALQDFDHDFEEGDDIRAVLTRNYPIVPAFSVPYTLDEKKEPTFKQEE